MMRPNLVMGTAIAVALAASSQLSWAEDYPEPAKPPTVEAEAPAVIAEPVAAPADKPAPSIAERPEVHRGLASWYGPRFHGKRTASGEVYNMYALTAAHPFLPFGTLVRVRNLISGKMVDVRVNDRGPFIKRRVIDLSKAAAAVLGLHEPGGGTPPVAITVLHPDGHQERAATSGRLSRAVAHSKPPAIR